MVAIMEVQRFVIRNLEKNHRISAVIRNRFRRIDDLPFSIV
jgi:hypothetical protein